ncbi:hypothetical protein ABB55_19380 [Prosthecomicrobium hirschii]|uniref:Uncharacterized protein n=1 Tax=Prosthecodimorpha hirschii TaxID=665126 RepID=A0A0P6VSD0_9HYPH|nr:hypothetical protein [Prosthecomicrobium hirschii]KPL54109.1 hypothetical protein ABB55_19380 [Prosthecomicrobium hirschii]
MSSPVRSRPVAALLAALLAGLTATLPSRAAEPSGQGGVAPAIPPAGPRVSAPLVPGAVTVESLERQLLIVSPHAEPERWADLHIRIAQLLLAIQPSLDDQREASRHLIAARKVVSPTADLDRYLALANGAAEGLASVARITSNPGLLAEAAEEYRAAIAVLTPQRPKDWVRFHLSLAWTEAERSELPDAPEGRRAAALTAAVASTQAVGPDFLPELWKKTVVVVGSIAGQWVRKHPSGADPKLADESLAILRRALAVEAERPDTFDVTTRASIALHAVDLLDSRFDATQDVGSLAEARDLLLASIADLKRKQQDDLAEMHTAALALVLGKLGGAHGSAADLEASVRLLQDLLAKADQSSVPATGSWTGSVIITLADSSLRAANQFNDVEHYDRYAGTIRMALARLTAANRSDVIPNLQARLASLLVARHEIAAAPALLQEAVGLLQSALRTNQAAGLDAAARQNRLDLTIARHWLARHHRDRRLARAVLADQRALTKGFNRATETSDWALQRHAVAMTLKLVAELDGKPGLLDEAIKRIEEARAAMEETGMDMAQVEADRLDLYRLRKAAKR